MILFSCFIESNYIAYVHFSKISAGQFVYEFEFTIFKNLNSFGSSYSKWFSAVCECEISNTFLFCDANISIIFWAQSDLPDPGTPIII